MFTGIIKEIGVIESIKPNRAFTRLSVRAGGLSKKAGIGDSISINGTCLTVVNKDKDKIFFDVINETLKKTALAFIKVRDNVNLEPALKLDKGLSGHLVSGHIDEVGRVESITKQAQGVARIIIGVSPKGLGFLVEKGSVAVDGISLTVNRLGRDSCVLDIIPHTLKETILQYKKTGDKVNIEYDMIAKHAVKALASHKKSAIDQAFLAANGF